MRDQDVDPPAETPLLLVRQAWADDVRPSRSSASSNHGRPRSQSPSGGPGTVTGSSKRAKGARLAAMRDQDRERAMLKAAAYRAVVEEAVQYHKDVITAEKQRLESEELARLAGIAQRRLQTIGAAHKEAAEYTARLDEERAVQSERLAHFDQLQVRRVAMCLASPAASPRVDHRGERRGCQPRRPRCRPCLQPLTHSQTRQLVNPPTWLLIRVNVRSWTGGEVGGGPRGDSRGSGARGGRAPGHGAAACGRVHQRPASSPGLRCRQRLLRPAAMPPACASSGRHVGRLVSGATASRACSQVERCRPEPRRRPFRPSTPPRLPSASALKRLPRPPRRSGAGARATAWPWTSAPLACTRAWVRRGQWRCRPWWRRRCRPSQTRSCPRRSCSTGGAGGP
jgi:hypothetical protein